MGGFVVDCSALARYAGLGWVGFEIRWVAVTREGNERGARVSGVSGASEDVCGWPGSFARSTLRLACAVLCQPWAMGGRIWPMASIAGKH